MTIFAKIVLFLYLSSCIYHKLFLTRVQDIEQPTDYIEGDAFPAATHEDTLDKVVLQIQQQQEQINRAFKISQSNNFPYNHFYIHQENHELP